MKRLITLFLVLVSMTGLSALNTVNEPAPKSCKFLGYAKSGNIAMLKLTREIVENQLSEGAKSLGGDSYSPEYYYFKRQKRGKGYFGKAKVYQCN